MLEIMANLKKYKWKINIKMGKFKNFGKSLPLFGESSTTVTMLRSSIERN